MISKMLWPLPTLHKKRTVKTATKMALLKPNIVSFYLQQINSYIFGHKNVAMKAVCCVEYEQSEVGNEQQRELELVKYKIERHIISFSYDEETCLFQKCTVVSPTRILPLYSSQILILVSNTLLCVGCTVCSFGHVYFSLQSQDFCVYFIFRHVYCFFF